MIERLEGDLLEMGSGHLLVGIGGLGIRVSVPRTATDRLQGVARGVLWTRLLVREGDPQLYGFLETEERGCFDALLAVSGVGPRIALAILSAMPPDALAMEAERGSIDRLVTVSGVGKKLAGRIVLELKGKLPLVASSTDPSGEYPGPTATSRSMPSAPWRRWDIPRGSRGRRCSGCCAATTRPRRLSTNCSAKR